MQEHQTCDDGNLAIEALGNSPKFFHLLWGGGHLLHQRVDPLMCETVLLVQSCPEKGAMRPLLLLLESCIARLTVRPDADLGRKAENARLHRLKTYAVAQSSKSLGKGRVNMDLCLSPTSLRVVRNTQMHSTTTNSLNLARPYAAVVGRGSWL